MEKSGKTSTATSVINQNAIGWLVKCAQWTFLVSDISISDDIERVGWVKTVFIDEIGVVAVHSLLKTVRHYPAVIENIVEERPDIGIAAGKVAEAHVPKQIIGNCKVDICICTTHCRDS